MVQLWKKARRSRQRCVGEVLARVACCFVSLSSPVKVVPVRERVMSVKHTAHTAQPIVYLHRWWPQKEQ